MPNSERVKLREKLIKYMGLSDRRVLYKSDLSQFLGIEDPEEDIVWDRNNNWSIPAEKLPDQVVEYCQHDREFAIVEQ